MACDNSLHKTFDTLVEDEGLQMALETLQDIQGSLESVLEAHPSQEEHKAAAFLLEHINDIIMELAIRTWYAVSSSASRSGANNTTEKVTTGHPLLSNPNDLFGGC